ncbi:facilitated trehalose transporter Tret1-like isoform X3 [Diabrotica virgifera virgifera]|uniref:Major facilitator superfamily (MFS) profile domain-containing protein n=1 Tax=Diabrotica virgifera virgifera TaxID=50390 RepID=A0ABM5K0Z6_DIAVI|nr:facilitated trehalose transporter Tret1-like isoform X2 [Diabrotica virgifera virgifera]XP_050503859.1 facilitated trehalose transporter Tret1-like isoform X3 [Diabrotica virgifera virgifera]
MKYEDDQNVGRKKPDTLFLYFAVVTATLLMLVNAALSVWTSPAIVKMQSNNTDENILGRPITTWETSILLGVPGLASLVGSAFLPKLADILGRKKSMQLMGLGTFLSTIGLAFCNTINLMTILSCFIQIFCAGVTGILPIYLTEICEDHNRAKHGCLMTAFSPIGQVYALILGPLFDLKVFTLLLSAPMVPFLVLFFFAPESPVHLLSKGMEKECIESLQKLRRNKTKKEIENDYHNLEINKSIKGSEENRLNFIQLFGTKEGRVGLMLAFIPILSQNLSGVQIIFPLLGPIFNDSGSKLSGDTIAVIAALVKLITFTIITFVIETTGRKPMLIVSSIGAGISSTTLGVFFYLKYINSPFIESFHLGPLLSVSAFIISYSIGLGPIPMAIICELFPSDLRSTALAIISTVSALVITGYTTFYPLLAELIHTHWCMWIFGLSCFAGTFFISTMLPEVRGKSVLEIQEILRNYTLCMK